MQREDASDFVHPHLYNLVGARNRMVTQLGEVDQSLDAGCINRGGKSAKGGQIDDLDFDQLAFVIGLGNAFPGIRQQLFEAQAETATLQVYVKDVDLDFLSFPYDFCGMFDPLPGEFGNVK